MAGAAEPRGVDYESQQIERLFALYADRLHRHIFHYVRSWEAAEDLVQDLFLRLWDRRDELNRVDDIEGYLYMAARNRALTYLRNARIEHEWGQATQPGPTESASVTQSDQAISAEIAAAIQRAVDSLPARQREALLLQWKGTSHAGIAAELGISPRTVGIHLGRAVKHLRRALLRFRG